jgi:hypothetical protein
VSERGEGKRREERVMFIDVKEKVRKGKEREGHEYIEKRREEKRRRERSWPP